MFKLVKPDSKEKLIFKLNVKENNVNDHKPNEIPIHKEGQGHKHNHNKNGTPESINDDSDATN